MNETQTENTYEIRDNPGSDLMSLISESIARDTRRYARRFSDGEI